MGQKVNPNGLRLGINKDWEAKWYSNKKDFANYLDRDVKIREFLEKNLNNAGIAKVEIERNAKKTEVVIHTSKPGVMIGHGGEEIEKLKKQLSKIADENVQKNPGADAVLAACAVYGSLRWPCPATAGQQSQ